MRLGELLIGMGAITEAQLIEALSAQLVTGGRLGTKLLQLEYIDIVTLTRALAHKHGVRPALPDMLYGISPQVLAVMPKEAAAKCQAIPLGVMRSKSLGVAFVDPTNLALVDAVRFATGYQIVPFVAAELLVARFLERHYAVPVPLGLRERPQIKRDDANARMVRGAPGIRTREEQPAAPPKPQSSFGEPSNLPAVEARPRTPIGFSAAVPSQQAASPLQQALASHAEWAKRPAAPYVTRTPGQPTIPDIPEDQVPRARRRTRSTDVQAPEPVSSSSPPARRTLTPDEQRLVEAAFAMPLDVASLEVAFAAGEEAEADFDIDVASMITPKPVFAEALSELLGTLPKGGPVAIPGMEILEPAAEPLDQSPFDELDPSMTFPEATPAPIRVAEIRPPVQGATPAPGMTRTIPAAAPARVALCLDDALANLGKVDSMDALAQTVCDYLRSTFAIGLVLKVKGEMALGFHGFAPACDQERIESILVPLGSTSAFQMASSRKAVFRGAPPQAGGDIHKQLWKLLRCEPPSEVVVCPLIAGQRVVLLVFGALFGGALPATVNPEMARLQEAGEQAIRSLIVKDRNSPKKG